MQQTSHTVNPNFSLDESLGSGNISLTRTLGQSHRDTKYDMLYTNQLFQPKLQRRQFRQDILNATQDAAVLRSALRFVLRGEVSILITLVLTIGFLFLVLIRVAFRDEVEESTIKSVQVMQFAFATGFCLEVGVECCAYRKRICMLWTVADTLVTLWTLATLLWGLTTDSKIADLSSFFAIFRLFRIVHKYPKPQRRRRVHDTKETRMSNSVYVVESAPRRLLDLLRYLLTDPYIRGDSNLVTEIQWGVDIISSSSLNEHMVPVPSESPQFKEKDLMNLVKHFSAAPITPGTLGRQRASSFCDNIPLVQLDVALPEGALSCLMEVDTFDFNVLTLKAVTAHNELRTLMHIFFARMELFQNTGMSPGLFSNFIERVQNGYIATNPYHNATHAADVLQALHFYLGTCEAAEWLDISSLELAGCYLAAAIHDYQHPGVNNAFLVTTQAELAIRYNDRSVLENHHVSSAFSLTLNEQYDFLAQLPHDDFLHIRSLMIEMVLSTDVAQHFNLINKFKGKMLALGAQSKSEDKILALSLLLHAADISNASRPWDLCKAWTDMVMEEFWQQGDKEREQGLPIGYMMDKFTVNVAKSQVGFIDVIVQPLFSTLRETLQDLNICCKNLEANRAKWQSDVENYENELEARKKDGPGETPSPLPHTSLNIS